MAIYWVNILLTPIHRLFFWGDKNKRKFLFIVCFQMFLLLAARSGDMTVDEWQYEAVHNSIRQLEFTDLISRWSFFRQMNTGSYLEESGYSTMDWVCSRLLGVNFHTYLVILALFHIYCMYKFLDYFSDCPLLGAMIFQSSMIHNYIQILKRSTAASIIFLALIEVSKKNYKKSLALTFLACTMHRSTLLFFIIIPLSQIKMTKQNLLKTFYFMLAVTALLPFLRYIALSILSALHKNSHIASGGIFINFKMIVSLLVIVLMYFFVDARVFSSDKNNVLCWTLCFYVSVMPLESIVHILGAITMYFTPPFFVLMTNIILSRKDKTTRHVLQVVALLLAVYIFFNWTQGVRMSRETWTGNWDFKAFWS